MKKDNEFNLA